MSNIVAVLLLLSGIMIGCCLIPVIAIGVEKLWELVK
jgi:hypothetical protein